ncbi:mitochondrial fission ELM1 family protein [Coralliovum pocilloporae]|uniref:mitochondrial fission ELM1 family protein n=1 Tax=Coralliovum pocilloporae TaxID=3066369 RepID=UPI0033071213
MTETRNDQCLEGRRAWVLTDGKMGDRAQCLGLAERLGLDIEERVVAPGRPWHWFLPRGPIPPGDRPDQPGSPVHPPFPDLVIASGRRAAAYLPVIKKASAGRVFTVFLKDPRIGTGFADFIWVPAHDRLRGGNVMVTDTAPHRISPDVLESARAVVPEDWVQLPRPWLGLVVGDPTGGRGDQDQTGSAVLGQLEPLVRQAGSILVTPSRRTPAAFLEALSQHLAEKPFWIWSGEGDNPYRQILAQSDLLAVTGDSHNMVSEVLAAGCPVSVLRPPQLNPKLARFLDKLPQQGAVGDQKASCAAGYPQIDATPAIAQALAQAFSDFQQLVTSES